jgi:hypothetical protein
MIQLYLHGGHTMGDTLIAMCLFNSLGQPVHITTSIDSWYATWKRIFNIGDQIQLEPVAGSGMWPNPPHPKHLESFKVFSRYDQFDHVTVFGQSLHTGRRGKKSAAILINDGNYVKDDQFFANIQDKTDPYPFIKFHTKKTYDTILNLVQSAGYDPMIIDSRDISADHKVFLLNELCDFVIGYEGGMCHLAHALKIPAIILPWRVEPGEYHVTDFLHLDKRTYFIRNAKELDSWTADYLVDLVNNLHNETGYNNQWMISNTFPDPSEFVEHFRRGSDKKFAMQLDWVLQYTTQPTLGGY